MSLKSDFQLIQNTFNNCFEDDLISPDMAAKIYEKRSKILKAMLEETKYSAEVWHKAAKRYFDLMRQALETNNSAEANFYEMKYQEAKKNV